MQPDKDFQDFLQQGRFMIQRSRQTGAYVYYPRIAVPGTGDADLEWVEASGRAEVYSTSVVRNRPPAEDYNVAIVDLAEGPRMMTRVIGIEPDRVAIGMKVKAEVAEIDGQLAVVFRPEGGAA